MVTFDWKPLAHIFDPSHESNWMYAFSQNPCPIHLTDRVRVYFNTREKPDANRNYVARIAFVDLDPSDLSRVVAVSHGPVLALGDLGHFDEFGTMVASVGRDPQSGRMWLYYVGWTRMASVPFNWAIGLAYSDDAGLSFRKVGPGPVMGPTPDEPFLQACPNVYRIGDAWHMFYVSGIAWNPDPIEPIYRIFHATSGDGETWQRPGRAIVPTVVTPECQTSPTLLFHQGVYYMFFSYRSGIDYRNGAQGYRLGCATSSDLLHWHRDDSLTATERAASGWDAAMTCYPQLERVGSDIVMFHCGNEFGKYGFGASRLQASVDGSDRLTVLPRG